MTHQPESPVRKRRKLSNARLGLVCGQVPKLPRELIGEIVLHLPVDSVVTMYRVCKRWYEYLHSEFIWNCLLMRDYSKKKYFKKKLSDGTMDGSPIVKYKELYKLFSCGVCKFLAEKTEKEECVTCQVAACAECIEDDWIVCDECGTHECDECAWNIRYSLSCTTSCGTCLASMCKNTTTSCFDCHSCGAHMCARCAFTDNHFPHWSYCKPCYVSK